MLRSKGFVWLAGPTRRHHSTHTLNTQSLIHTHHPQVLRSKGFVWLAGPTRHDHVGEWSSAGNLLRFGTGGPWYAVLPRCAWVKRPGPCGLSGMRVACLLRVPDIAGVVGTWAAPNTYRAAKVHLRAWTV